MLDSDNIFRTLSNRLMFLLASMVIAVGLAFLALTLTPEEAKAETCFPGENRLLVKLYNGNTNNVCHVINRDKTRSWNTNIKRIRVDLSDFEGGTCSIYVRKKGGSFARNKKVTKVGELSGGQSLSKSFKKKQKIRGVRFGC